MDFRSIIKELIRFPKRNIYEHTFPFLVYFKFLNIFYLKLQLEYSDDTIVVMSRSEKLYCIFCSLIQIILIYFALTENIVETTIPVLDIGNYIYTVITTIFILFVYIYSIIHKESFQKIMKIIHEYDMRVSNN